jgi:hypothetical protein
MPRADPNHPNYIKTRTLLCMFLVRPLAGFAGQRPHQKRVLRGGFAAPAPPPITLYQSRFDITPERRSDLG